MKRTEALQPLSRDHHQALVISKKINQAQLQDRVEQKQVWHNVRTDQEALLKHFVIEERKLMPLLNANPELQQRLVSDHDQLRGYLKDDSFEAAVPFAELLKAHVRFEERELFPWLECNFTDIDLLEVMHPDEF